MDNNFTLKDIKLKTPQNETTGTPIFQSFKIAKFRCNEYKVVVINKTAYYSKTCLKRSLKNWQNKGLKDRW